MVPSTVSGTVEPETVPQATVEPPPPLAGAYRVVATPSTVMVAMDVPVVRICVTVTVEPPPPPLEPIPPKAPQPSDQIPV